MNTFATQAVHPVPSGKQDIHAALRTPVYDSVAFEFETAREMELAFTGKRPSHTYSRISNPTVEQFELQIRALSGAVGVVAVSSGMSAITTSVLALAGTGTNIVTSRHLFGNTLSLFERTLRPWGLETRYVDLNDPEEVAGAMDSNTKLVFCETITNPQMEVVDISMLAGIAERHHVPLVVDGTVTTPYLFNGKEHGAAVEVISSTKYISGGATSIGGVIVDHGGFDWKQAEKLASEYRAFGRFAFLMKLRREVYRNTGACLSPHNAWLQTLGLETMPLRIEKSCENAYAAADFLESHEKVTSVNYPGLDSSPYHVVAEKQFRGRFGGILTFELQDQERCYLFMDNLKLIRRATNLNDNKTLVLHPWSTIFCEFSDKQKKAMSLSSSMVRLSCGIEDSSDIIRDMTQALEAI